jgi:hypothetical protein
MKTKFNPWPLGIVIVFVVFIGGMATAVTIACSHRDHLVDENYYETELKFQSQIDGAARAKQAGATVSQLAGGNVLVQLPAAQLAQKISGAIKLYRPSAPELDRVVALQPDAQGAQTVDISKLAAGAWVLRVNWNAGGEKYFIEQKIKI